MLNGKPLSSPISHEDHATKLVENLANQPHTLQTSNLPSYDENTFINNLSRRDVTTESQVAEHFPRPIHHFHTPGF